MSRLITAALAAFVSLSGTASAAEIWSKKVKTETVVFIKGDITLAMTTSSPRSGKTAQEDPPYHCTKQ